jgi:hypothetical protein
MKKKPARANFRISIEEFYSVMKSRIGFMLRDKDEFVKFGITENHFNELNDMLETFGAIQTDEELLGVQIAATQTRDEAAAQLRDSITSIMTRAANKFGAGSGYYRKFGVSGLARLDNGALSSCARRVQRVATEYQADLQTEGLSAEVMKELDNRQQIFNEALARQEDAIAERDIAAEKRIDHANVIYSIIVKYCFTGKRIWEGKNEARYNDYVLYDSLSSPYSASGEEELQEAS